MHVTDRILVSVCSSLPRSTQPHQFFSRLFRAKMQSGRLRLPHEPTSLNLKTVSIGVLVFLRQEETPQRWEVVDADGCVSIPYNTCRAVRTATVCLSDSPRGYNLDGLHGRPIPIVIAVPVNAHISRVSFSSIQRILELRMERPSG